MKNDNIDYFALQNPEIYDEDENKNIKKNKNKRDVLSQFYTPKDNQNNIIVDFKINFELFLIFFLIY